MLVEVVVLVDGVGSRCSLQCDPTPQTLVVIVWDVGHSCVVHLVKPLSVLSQLSLCKEGRTVVGTIVLQYAF